MGSHAIKISEEDILFNWDRNLDCFFEWLIEVCGLHRESNTFRNLKTEITSLNDLSEFVDCFDGDFDKIGRTRKRYLIKVENRKN